MAQFLSKLCTICGACSNLITLEPGPEQCDKCIKAEGKIKEEDVETDVEAVDDQEEDEPVDDDAEEEEEEEDAEEDDDDEEEDEDVETPAPEQIKLTPISSGGTKRKIEVDTLATPVSSKVPKQEPTVTTSTVEVPVTPPANPFVVCIPKPEPPVPPAPVAKPVSPQMPKGPAIYWSIEDVVNFITLTDPALKTYEDIFRQNVSFHPAYVNATM